MSAPENISLVGADGSIIVVENFALSQPDGGDREIYRDGAIYTRSGIDAGTGNKQFTWVRNQVPSGS